jgi:hypothetical protein
VPKPPLYRASRYVSIAATVVSLILLLYVGATIYSASQIRPGESKGSNIGDRLTSAGLELTASINFSNPGFLPINDVHLASVVYAPGHGSLITVGASPHIRVEPGTTGVIPLTMLIPFGPGSPVIPLLTHDAELPTSVWANVSFGSVFSVTVQIPTNISWGAPFSHLNVSLSTTPDANGTLVPAAQLSFVNNASFALDGTLALTLHGSGGCTATLPDFVLNVPSKSGYSQSVTFSPPSSCATATWSTLDGSFTSPTWSSPLPTENLP